MDHLMTEDDHRGIKSFVQRLRRGSIGFHRRTDGVEADGTSPLRRNSSPKGHPFYSKAAGGSSGAKKNHPMGDLSLNLWNTAYEALRDSPATGAMVVAYESIISQELPVHLRSGGMNTSFRNRPEDERLALLTVITKSGLEKRRGSKTSQVDEVSRTIIDEVKGAIGQALAEERATAVAWAGLCTLTPLLLDPILRLEALRMGLFHVTGRIGWYMALPYLLLRDSWKQGADFDRLADSTRDRISRIARKALEFEMNVICATASAWNAQAKNTVRWANLPNLVAELLEMDQELAEHIEAYAGESVVAEFARRYRDFVEPPPDETTEQPGQQTAVLA